uniref:PREDICTED: similar to Tigger transposable elementderived protein 6 putative n=1 Tax=Albugo laibachii Nc14 TaxID=890382 RepID=F0WQ56_9STRA|nr:PREDICTED: similar to Tigger transposable elementderived protein 6 putative [Albugo laibachii Nc14]|eukprot:CCA23461.1 PREDICTED: similar to Tigger transposable elementderived protein 6 putative [Albugo laibachii Nc14]
MTRALFQEWLDELNERMKKEGRHILLLLDNASAHCAEKLLSNVEIEMLPPNTTSVLQTMDAGVIACLKAYFHRRQGCHAVDVADSVIDDEEKCTKDIYKVDVLQAMHWCRDAWESVTQSTTENCWKHTGIIPEDLYELIQGIANVHLKSTQ